MKELDQERCKVPESGHCIILFEYNYTNTGFNIFVQYLVPENNFNLDFLMEMAVLNYDRAGYTLRKSTLSNFYLTPKSSCGFNSHLFLTHKFIEKFSHAILLTSLEMNSRLSSSHIISDICLKGAWGVMN